MKTVLPCKFGHEKTCEVMVVYTCDAEPLAQVELRVRIDGHSKVVMTVSNTGGTSVTATQRISLPYGEHPIELAVHPSVKVKKLMIRQAK